MNQFDVPHMRRTEVNAILRHSEELRGRAMGSTFRSVVARFSGFFAGSKSGHGKAAAH